MYLIFLASLSDCGVIWETADRVSVIRRGVRLNPLRFLPPDRALHEWMTTGLFDARFRTRSLNLSSSPPDSMRGLPTAPRAHALPPWARCLSARPSQPQCLLVTASKTWNTCQQTVPPTLVCGLPRLGEEAGPGAVRSRRTLSSLSGLLTPPWSGARHTHFPAAASS